MHDTAAPIVDDDAAIRSAVAAADVPPLLVAVAHATGDRSILRPELRPDPLLLMDPEVGYTPETKAEAWRLAAGALIAWRRACVARWRAQCAPPRARPSRTTW